MANSLDKFSLRDLILNEIGGLIFQEAADSDGDGDVDLDDVATDLSSAAASLRAVGEEPDEDGIDYDKALKLLSDAVKRGMMELKSGVLGLPDRGAEWQMLKGKNFQKMLDIASKSKFDLDKKGAVQRTLESFRLDPTLGITDELRPIHREIADVSVEVATLIGTPVLSS